MFSPIWNPCLKRLWIFYDFLCLEYQSENTFDFLRFLVSEGPPSEKTLDFYVFPCLQSPSAKPLEFLCFHLYEIHVCGDFEYFWKNTFPDFQFENTEYSWNLFGISEDFEYFWESLSGIPFWGSFGWFLDPCPTLGLHLPFQILVRVSVLVHNFRPLSESLFRGGRPSPSGGGYCIQSVN